MRKESLIKMRLFLLAYQQNMKSGKKFKLQSLQNYYHVSHFPRRILNGIEDTVITDEVAEEIRRKSNECSKLGRKRDKEDVVLEKREDITAAELVARLESLGYMVRLFRTQYVEVDVKHIIRDNHRIVQGDLFDEEEIR